MANTIHQYGSGDHIAADKVMGDKVAGNKIGTQINGGNIANVVNEARNQAQVVATGVNQSSGVSTAELLIIIASLRQMATQFPPAVQEDLIIDIDDVEAEIQKPEEQSSLPKLKKRLTALATAAALMASGVSATHGFVDNVIDLSGKLGIELPLPPQPWPHCQGENPAGRIGSRRIAWEPGTRGQRLADIGPTGAAGSAIYS